MTAKDQLHILNEKINKVRREHQAPYVITIQDEIDIHIALKDEPKQVTDAEIEYQAKHSPVEQKKSCETCDPMNPAAYCMRCNDDFSHWKPKPEPK